MEIVISVFIGGWICLASVLAYKRYAAEFAAVLKEDKDR